MIFKSLHDKYGLFDILSYVDTRPKRMNLERIFGLVATSEHDILSTEPSIYGTIHHYIHWGFTFKSYLDNIDNHKLDLIKVWTGR